MTTSYFNLMLEYVRQAESQIDDDVLEQIYTLYYNIPLFDVPKDEAQILRARICQLGSTCQLDHARVWHKVLIKNSAVEVGYDRLLDLWSQRCYLDPQRIYALQRWGLKDWGGAKLEWDLWFGPNPLKLIYPLPDKHGKKVRFQAHVLERVLGDPKDLKGQKAILRHLRDERQGKDYYTVQVEELYAKVADAYGIQDFDYTTLKWLYKDLCELAL